MKDFVFLIHGGAGVISKSTDPVPYKNALQEIISKIFAFANEGNTSALDIAEYGAMLLENEVLFNAGRGAVFASNGKHELEASIMDGKTKKCGAVSLLTRIKNPVSVARLVMEKTKHNYIAGESAEEFARNLGVEFVENSYFSTEKRRHQWEEAKKVDLVCNDHDLEKSNFKKGTIGCVCMKLGHVAAATSTGGMTNKMAGRIGDTPINGAGNYANDSTCAVSGTGVGEEFMRHLVAYDISARMEYSGMTVEEAARSCVNQRLPADAGGVIAVDKAGQHAMEFNSLGMFRGYCDSEWNGQVGVWEEMEAVPRIL